MVGSVSIEVVNYLPWTEMRLGLSIFILDDFDVFWQIASCSSESGSTALDRIIFKSYESLIAQFGKFEDVGQAGINEDNWRNLTLFGDTAIRR